MGGGKAHPLRFVRIVCGRIEQGSGGMLQAGRSTHRMAVILLRLVEFNDHAPNAAKEEDDGRERPHDTTDRRVNVRCLLPTKTTNLSRTTALDLMRRILGSHSPYGECRVEFCSSGPLVGVVGAVSISTLPCFFVAVSKHQPRRKPCRSSCRTREPFWSPRPLIQLDRNLSGHPTGNATHWEIRQDDVRRLSQMARHPAERTAAESLSASWPRNLRVGPRGHRRRYKPTHGVCPATGRWRTCRYFTETSQRAFRCSALLARFEEESGLRHPVEDEDECRKSFICRRDRRHRTLT